MYSLNRIYYSSYQLQQIVFACADKSHSQIDFDRF